MSPLGKYHSGFRNQVFYLYGGKSFRARFEYFSSDSSRPQIEVAFLLNHQFIRPVFLDSMEHTIKNGVYTFKVTPNTPLIVHFEVQVLGLSADDFYISINSIEEPFYNPMDSIVYLNSAIQYHCNLVKWFYRLKPRPQVRQPDTTKSLPIQKGMDVVVLKKDKSLAIINKAGKTISFVISQINETPIYVKVKAFQSATFRNILSSGSNPVIVTDMPFAKMENFLGHPRVKPHFSFFFSKGKSHADSH